MRGAEHRTEMFLGVEPSPGGDVRLSRRALIGGASGLVLAAGAVAASRLPLLRTVAEGRPTPLSSIEVVVVDAPLVDGVEPAILGRRTLPMIAASAATTFEGTIPAHRFRVAAERGETRLRLAIDVDLHGRPRRSLVADLDAALGVRRLWVGRRYLHVDRGEVDSLAADDAAGSVLAHYPAPPAEPYRDEVAFAMPADDGGIGHQRFAYRYDTPQGLIGLDLPAGARFRFEWEPTAQLDGSRVYRTTWSRGDHVVLRLEERVRVSDKDSGPFGAMPVTIGVDGEHHALYVARPSPAPCCAS